MILNFPDEIQERVFHYCSIRDLKNLSLTCSSYNNALRPSVSHSIRISAYTLLETSDVHYEQLLENVKHAKSIRFIDNALRKKKGFYLELAIKFKKILDHSNPRVLKIFCYFPRTGFNSVIKFSNLVELHIGPNAKIDAKILQEMYEVLQLLQALYLRTCKIKSEELENISNLTSLRKLGVSMNPVTDEGLKHISLVKDLKTLNLFSCTSVTDIGLSYIANLSSLVSLNIHGCFRITDAGLSSISVIPSLEGLDLCGCERITDYGVTCLSKLASLKMLSVGFCRKVTDLGISSLRDLHKLEKLDISWTKVTDTSLSYMSSFPRLVNLNMSSTAVSNSGLKYLRRLRGLKDFAWRLSNITEKGLRKNRLGKFTNPVIRPFDWE